MTIKYVDEDENDVSESREETKQIGDEYKIYPKYIEGFELKNVKGNQSGVITRENTEITFVYKKAEKQKNTVFIKHLEKTTNQILAEETIEGEEDNQYRTTKKDIENYRQTEDRVDKSTGKITEEPIYVIYYYEKIPAKVSSSYVDENGNRIAEQAIENKYFGDKYLTHKKFTEGYEFDKVEGNEEGTVTRENIEVTYKYKRKQSKLIVRYLEENTNRILANADVGFGDLNARFRATRKQINNYKSAGDGIETEYGIMDKEIVYLTYYYSRIPSKVIVRYLELGTDRILLEEKTINGYMGESYTTRRQKIDKYKSAGEEPQNAVGLYSEEVKYVNYYYEQIKYGKVVVRHINIATNQDLLPNDELEGEIGKEYVVEAKNMSNYNVVQERMPENNVGRYQEEGTEVIFYYQKKGEPVTLTDETNEDEEQENALEINNVLPQEEKINAKTSNRIPVWVFAVAGLVFATSAAFGLTKLLDRK